MRIAALALFPALLALAPCPALALDASACKAITDGVQRLACYDALAAAPPTPTPQPKAATPAPNAPSWAIVEGKSQIDGSAEVVATKSDGGDSFSGNDFVVACKARKTQATIVSRAIRGGALSGGQLPVQYNVDNEAPVAQRWPVVAGGSLFSTTLSYPQGADAVAFLKALPGAATLHFKITDFQGAPHELAFALAGLDEVRALVGKACKWPGAQ